MKQYVPSNLRTSQIMPFQPESQVHIFGLVQFPLTHDGEQIARNMNIQQGYDQQTHEIDIMIRCNHWRMCSYGGLQ